MKRPIVFFGAVFFLIAAVRNAADAPAAKRRLARAESLLTEAADARGRVTATGIVEESSAVTSGSRFLIREIVLASGQNPEVSLESGQAILFTMEESGTDLVPGDVVTVRGKAEFFETATVPGQFDARAYYQNKDTVCRLADPELLQVHMRTGGVRAALHRFRNVLRVSYLRILGKQEAQTIAAISLGEKSWMDPEIKAGYQEGGIAHIASVSGLHASMIGLSLYHVFRRCLLPVPVSAAVSGLGLFLYVLMTGSGISAVRAFLMFGLWLFAQAAGRKYDGKTAVAVSAALILLMEPRYLQDTSFLLSFGAMEAILFLLPEMQRALLPEKGEAGQKGMAAVGERLGRMLLPGFAVWLGMLPLTLYFFYQTPPWSIFLNLLVVPLMPVLMGLGLLGALAGLICEPVGQFLAAPVHYLLRLFEVLTELELRLPGGVWVMGRPTVFALLGFYALLVIACVGSVWLQRKRRAEKDLQLRRRSGEKRDIQLRRRSGEKKDIQLRRRCGEEHNVRLKERGRCLYGMLLWGVCAGLGLFMLRSPAPAALEIFCFDVGQGDSALLRIPDGTVCMIDGGSSTETGLWKYRLGQAVKYYGIDTIDCLFLSHADADHTSGIQEFLESYEVAVNGRNSRGITLRELVLPPTADPEDFAELRRLAGQKGIAVSRMACGARAAGDNRKSSHKNWSLTCLWPEAEALSGDRNEDSMVLMLQYGAFRMLFTGDLEGASESALTEKAECMEALPERPFAKSAQQTALMNAAEAAGGTGSKDLRADVLKVGHHGSKNGCSKPFLAQVQPKLAVISCAAGNRYGHPAKETLERLEEAGCAVLCTPSCGTVRVRTDGVKFSVETFR